MSDRDEKHLKHSRERTAFIMGARERGDTIADIGRALLISPSRVRQIIAREKRRLAALPPPPKGDGE